MVKQKIKHEIEEYNDYTFSMLMFAVVSLMMTFINIIALLMLIGVFGTKYLWLNLNFLIIFNAISLIKAGGIKTILSPQKIKKVRHVIE